MTTVMLGLVNNKVIVAGLNGISNDKVEYHHVTSPHKIIEEVLKGERKVYSDLVDGFIYLPQYCCLNNVVISDKKIIVFVEGKNSEFKSCYDFQGESGIYWYPPSLKQNYIGNRDIYFITGKTAKLLKDAENVVHEICTLVARHHSNKKGVNALRIVDGILNTGKALVAMWGVQQASANIL